MSAILVYITVGDPAEADTIANAIVQQRLAACANILPGMRSIYHWQGKVETGAETVVLFKTRTALFDQLAARVKELHSYDTPCIVAMPLTQATPDYFGWIMDETQPDNN